MKALRASATIQTVRTSELENRALAYERGMSPRLTTFERTAILKGINAELAERTQLRLALE